MVATDTRRRETSTPTEPKQGQTPQASLREGAALVIARDVGLVFVNAAETVENLLDVAQTFLGDLAKRPQHPRTSGTRSAP
jgi:hypothetical protein